MALWITYSIEGWNKVRLRILAKSGEGRQFAVESCRDEEDEQGKR